MNKEEAVHSIKEELLVKEINLTAAQVATVVTIVLDSMTAGAAKDGHSVFGKHRFERIVRAARTGRDFQNKAALAIPEKTIITYRHTGA